MTASMTGFGAIVTWSHGTTWEGNQEKQLLDVSGCLFRLEEQM